MAPCLIADARKMERPRAFRDAACPLFLLTLVTSSLVQPQPASADAARHVDLAHAKALAALALDHPEAYGPPLVNDFDRRPSWFVISFRDRASTESRSFSVNPWTGDVWDSDRCVTSQAPGTKHKHFA